MMNEKHKHVLQISVIFLFFVLFICSCIYTLAVYLSVKQQPDQSEVVLKELCHPYVALSNIPPIKINEDSGTGFNFGELYVSHPKCFDALLPVFCQILFPRIIFPLGSGVEPTIYINTLLIEECTSAITNLTLLYGFALFPTVYYQDITCADGFYLLNNTCRPHCTEFEQIDHKDAQIRIGFWYFVTISNIIITVLFIVTACFKRKTVLKFPSILILYIIIAQSAVPISVLINLLSGRALLCSDDDLAKSLEKPSPYCTISGIVSSSGLIIPWLWVVLTGMMLWKLLFPIHAHRHHKFEKWIHIFPFAMATLFLIPYVIVTSANEDFYNIPVGFPSFVCITRNSDFLVMYLLFPLLLLCSLGVFLLSIILFNIQMRYGCSIWRNNDVINTAEKKIIFLLCFVSIISTVSGIYYTVLLSTGNEFGAAFYRYLLCELPGYIMNNENDMTTCSKDEIEKYSYTGLSITHIIFTYTLMPLMFLLTIIEWKSLIQKMTGLLHLDSETTTSHLTQLTTSRIISNPTGAKEKNFV